jgi:hypothetical protein
MSPSFPWTPTSGHGTMSPEVPVEKTIRSQGSLHWNPIALATLLALGCAAPSGPSPFVLEPADWHVDGCRWAAFEGVNPASAWVDTSTVDGLESAFRLHFVVMEARRDKSFFVDHYDLADTDAISFKVVDPRVPGEGLVLSECTEPDLSIFGQVWTAISGSTVLDCAWLEEVEGCKKGELLDLFNAIFLLEDLVLSDGAGDILDVGTFGPLHAVIGDPRCDEG